MNKAKRQQIFERLRAENPHPTTELHYSTPFELLIAVILSAQATDKGVNLATARLFPEANTPAAILGLGVGCRISAAGVFRILLGETANPALLSALADGRPVAVTFTATRNHDSFQVKAARAELRPASPDDLPEMDRQNALFRDGLVEIGYSPVQAAGYCVWQSDDLVAIELVPERVFTQSPGPGAGTEIAR